MPNYTLAESSMEKIQIDGIDQAFIIMNSELESILFNRNLIGIEFTQKCEAATTAFLRHFEPELTPLIDEGLSELMLLSKGMYYWMHNAFAKVFQSNLEINFAATSRAEVTSNSAHVLVPYFNFDAPTANLIIGDVLASGATICTALSRYLEYHKLERVFLFSLAGSIIGGQALARFCHERNIELTIAYSLAAFGLATNGFDLSFLHPDTITNDKYRQLAMLVFKGKPVSAVGWDCGSQAQAIHKYKMLCWLEAEYWGLQDSDVFQLKERPTDIRLVEKEFSAFREHIPSLEYFKKKEEH
jgi:hypothetical protein